MYTDHACPCMRACRRGGSCGTRAPRENTGSFPACRRLQHTINNIINMMKIKNANSIQSGRFGICQLIIINKLISSIYIFNTEIKTKPKHRDTQIVVRWVTHTAISGRTSRGSRPPSPPSARRRRPAPRSTSG